MAEPNGRARVEDLDPWQRTRLGIVALVALLSVGTLVYRMLGLSWVDAYYQTVITVSTVGYTEIGDDVDTTYRLVSSLLILFGVGISAYTIGVTFDGLMEGRLREQLGRTRMERELDELENHIVVCGWGQVGQAISRSIAAQGGTVVVIDRRPELQPPESGHLVVGEATDDDILRRAGTGRAKGLIAALDSDADNLWVTLSARSLNSGLFIVARSNGPDAGPKLMQAGADRVVNPHEIGGNRMASLMLQPNVADFIGESMHDRTLEMRLAESPVIESSLLADRSLGESGLASATGVTVLAVRRPDGTFAHHPGADHRCEPGDVIISLGTPEQLYALRAWMDDDT